MAPRGITQKEVVKLDAETNEEWGDIRVRVLPFREVSFGISCVTAKPAGGDLGTQSWVVGRIMRSTAIPDCMDENAAAPAQG